MSRKELIEDIISSISMSRADAGKVLNCTFKAITEGLKRDGRVQITGFGSFELRNRSARIGRNPKTGESIKLEAWKVILFAPGKSLKVALE